MAPDSVTSSAGEECSNDWYHEIASQKNLQIAVLHQDIMSDILGHFPKETSLNYTLTYDCHWFRQGQCGCYLNKIKSFILYVPVYLLLLLEGIIYL